MKKVIIVLAAFAMPFLVSAQVPDSVSIRLNKLDSSLSDLKGTLNATKSSLLEFHKDYTKAAKIALSSPIPVVYGLIHYKSKDNDIQRVKDKMADLSPNAEYYKLYQDEIDDINRKRKNFLTGMGAFSGAWYIVGTVMMINSHNHIKKAGMVFTQNGIAFKF